MKTNNNPSVNMEKKIHPMVSYLILPVFAFANSGVVVENFSLDVLANSVSMGIIFGLVIGKSLGITTTILLLRRWGIVTLPRNSTLIQFFGVALLCGIGFTMSLFIGDLAATDHVFITNIKLGVLAGSTISAVLGAIVIRFFCTKETDANA